MSSFALFRTSLLTVLMRLGRVGLGIFALSLVLGALSATPTAFAAAHVPPHRIQIDATVQNFHIIDDRRALVQGDDGKLWFETGPFGIVPPVRTLVDTGLANNGLFENRLDFQFLSDTQVVVLDDFGDDLFFRFRGIDTWSREQVIDFDVASFQALSADQILALGTDNTLWLEHGPFGTVPPGRVQIDAHVKDFEGLSSTQVAVRGTDDNLWLVSAPFS
jgi:hypothetical protein